MKTFTSFVPKDTVCHYCNHIAKTRGGTATRDLDSHAVTIDCQYLHSLTFLSHTHTHICVCIYPLIWARNCHQTCSCLSVDMLCYIFYALWCQRLECERSQWSSCRRCVLSTWHFYSVSLRSYCHKWACVFQRKAPFLSDHILPAVHRR